MSAEAPRIGPGCKVRLHFAILLEDGTLADSTEGGEPWELTIGDGTLAQGLELAIYGLKPGDRQSLRIGPREGFGYPEDSRVHTLDRSEFPEDMTLAEGMIIGFTTPAGDEVPGAILAVDEQQVTVDFNHPLAGHEITFDVEILAVHPPTLQ
ncbi:MAG: FKBP-type peptidyl-prolyl cis-trans isomerase [Chromatiales bacterium]|nr:FKBP-type peptidyl-prolyl cis-trans isomerase [Chromatiales bacterium]